jgi:hypothetical protein
LISWSVSALKEALYLSYSCAEGMAAVRQRDTRDADA